MRFQEYEERPDTTDYAIGDVHGFADHLLGALDWCARDAEASGRRARIHLLGDYVDRGPDSRRVVDILMTGPGADHVEWLPLRGNHDHVFAAVCRDHRYELAREWWSHGGQQTLMSYGWQPLRDGLPSDIGSWVPQTHVGFLETLPVAARVGNRLFVHAGVRPGRPLDAQTDRDLMWIRNEFLKHRDDFGFVVVHGHSPEPGNPVDHGNRIAMDGGCFFTGRLAVAAFDPGEPKPRFVIANPVVADRMPRPVAPPRP